MLNSFKVKWFFYPLFTANNESFGGQLDLTLNGNNSIPVQCPPQCNNSSQWRGH